MNSNGMLGLQREATYGPSMLLLYMCIHAFIPFNPVQCLSIDELEYGCDLVRFQPEITENTIINRFIIRIIIIITSICQNSIKDYRG